MKMSQINDKKKNSKNTAPARICQVSSQYHFVGMYVCLQFAGEMLEVPVHSTNNIKKKNFNSCFHSDKMQLPCKRTDKSHKEKTFKGI